MTLLKSLKGFLNKKDYDFESPDIDLYNFHPQIRMYYALNGIFFTNKDSKIRLVWPIMHILLGLVATSFQIIFIHRGITLEDYPFASEAFCYLMILGTIPTVYTSILRNRDIVYNILEHINQDFLYITKLGPKYRDHFLKGQLLIWTLCWMWFGFCMFIISLYMGNTFVLLLYQSLFATQNEHQIRPLIFPMWLPKDDPYRTPNYEIFMVVEIFVIFIVFQTFCGYVYTQFHILLHYYNLMDLIIFDLEVLFEGLDESVVYLPKSDPRRVQLGLLLNRRMKRIVQWHLSVLRAMDTVSSLYGPTLVYQVLFSSIAICVIAYQVANQLEQGTIDFLFAILWVAAVLQLWIPCYLGTLIRDKAFSVSDACWNCGWHETPLGKMLLPDILIFIQRTQKPLTIQFTALPNLTLETFSSIMSTSYSYFNMLRQSTK